MYLGTAQNKTQRLRRITKKAIFEDIKAKEFPRTELQINNLFQRVPTDNTTYTYLGIPWECVQNIKYGKTNK